MHYGCFDQSQQSHSEIHVYFDLSQHSSQHVMCHKTISICGWVFMILSYQN